MFECTIYKSSRKVNHLIRVLRDKYGVKFPNGIVPDKIIQWHLQPSQSFIQPPYYEVEITHEICGFHGWSFICDEPFTDIMNFLDCMVVSPSYNRSPGKPEIYTNLYLDFDRRGGLELPVDDTALFPRRFVPLTEIKSLIGEI